MAYGTINADVIQSSVTGVSLGAGNATVFKNRIINGDMRIDQRNAGASSTPALATYLVDRFQTEISVVSKFTYGQNLNSVTPPVGFSNYLGCQTASAYSVGATDYFLLEQKIEGFNTADLGWGTANAKTVTLSFWAYSSLTGTFGGNLQNNAANRFYPFSYSIPTANTWTQISITIAGDTTGTWVGATNGLGLMVRWSQGTGSTYLGTAGSWGSTVYLGVTGQQQQVGTASATFYITGVQLEVGSSATGFEYVNYTTQLVMCQRYYESLTMTPYGNALASGYYSATVYTITYSYRVTKRTAPTVALGSTAAWNGTTPSIISASIDTLYLASTNSTSFFLAATAGQAGLTFSSEL